MSGCFEVVTVADESQMHKHCHLSFFSDSLILSWRDTRRFGRWFVVESADAFDPTRSPCPMTEYELFRANLFKALDNKRGLSKPICEMLLNQSLFNGVGNYIRSEILIRTQPLLNPWLPARQVLQKIKDDEESHGRSDTDLLSLTRDVCVEAFALGSYYGCFSQCGADRAKNEAYIRTVRRRFSSFRRCYGKRNLNMVCTKDSLGRAFWHDPAFSIVGRTMKRTDKDSWSEPEGEEELDEESDVLTTTEPLAVAPLLLESKAITEKRKRVQRKIDLDAFLLPQPHRRSHRVKINSASAAV